MSYLAGDPLSGQVLNFANSPDGKINQQSMDALARIYGQSSGVNMDAIRSQYAQYLDAMHNDFATGNSTAGEFDPTSAGRGAGTIDIGGTVYNTFYDPNTGKLNLSSDMLGVGDQRMGVEINPDGTYGVPGSFNAVTSMTATDWQQLAAVLAVGAGGLAAEGGYLGGAAAGSGGGVATDATGATVASGAAGSGYGATGATGATAGGAGAAGGTYAGTALAGESELAGSYLSGTAAPLAFDGAAATIPAWMSNAASTAGNVLTSRGGQALLGAGISALAGSGGGVESPPAAADSTSQLQASLAKLDDLFKGRDGIYQNAYDSSFNLGKNKLDTQREGTLRNLKFSLNDRGLTGGSADVDAHGQEQRTYTGGLSDVANSAQATKDSLIRADDSTRLNLDSQIRSGLSADSAYQSAATQQANNVSQAATINDYTGINNYLTGAAGLLAHGNQQQGVNAANRLYGSSFLGGSIAPAYNGSINR